MSAVVGQSQVLDYLSQLDDKAVTALLEQAKALRSGGDDAGRQLVKGESGKKPSGLCGAGYTCRDLSCADCLSDATTIEPEQHVSEGVGQPLEKDEADVECSREEKLAAADMLMRALELGDDKRAWELLQRRSPQPDLLYIGEGGWSCVHWAVHAAASAATDMPSNTTSGSADQDEVGCGACCGGKPMGGRDGRALLRCLLDQRVAKDATTRDSAIANVRTDDGATPLMFAAEAGDREICEWLLDVGADPCAKDSDGDSAAAWARSKQHEALALWLEELADAGHVAAAEADVKSAPYL